jgi:hypothetical protein
MCSMWSVVNVGIRWPGALGAMSRAEGLVSSTSSREHQAKKTLTACTEPRTVCRESPWSSLGRRGLLAHARTSGVTESLQLVSLSTQAPPCRSNGQRVGGVLQGQHTHRTWQEAGERESKRTSRHAAERLHPAVVLLPVQVSYCRPRGRCGEVCCRRAKDAQGPAHLPVGEERDAECSCRELWHYLLQGGSIIARPLTPSAPALVCMRTRRQWAGSGAQSQRMQDS